MRSMMRLARSSCTRLTTVLANTTNDTTSASSGLPEHEQDGAQQEEEVVDEVEDVVADDAAVGAPRGDLHVVALAGRAPPRGFVVAEAGEGDAWEVAHLHGEQGIRLGAARAPSGDLGRGVRRPAAAAAGAPLGP